MAQRSSACHATRVCTPSQLHLYRAALHREGSCSSTCPASTCSTAPPSSSTGPPRPQACLEGGRSRLASLSPCLRAGGRSAASGRRRSSARRCRGWCTRRCFTRAPTTPRSWRTSAPSRTSKRLAASWPAEDLRRRVRDVSRTCPCRLAASWPAEGWSLSSRTGLCCREPREQATVRWTLVRPSPSPPLPRCGSPSPSQTPAR